MRSRAGGTQHLAAQVLFNHPATRVASQIHYRRPYAHRDSFISKNLSLLPRWRALMSLESHYKYVKIIRRGSA